MQKPTKVLLGLASLWPIAYIIFFIVFFFSALILGPFGARTGETVSDAPPMMAAILGLHLLTMVAILALTVFYIIDIFRNERVDKDKKALWAIVIFMGSAIAMPIYWYLYFWKEPSIAGSPIPGQLNSANTASWTNEADASRRQEQYVPPPQPPNWRE